MPINTIRLIVYVLSNNLFFNPSEYWRTWRGRRTSGMEGMSIMYPSNIMPSSSSATISLPFPLLWLQCKMAEYLHNFQFVGYSRYPVTSFTKWCCVYSQCIHSVNLANGNRVSHLYLLAICKMDESPSVCNQPPDCRK